MSRAHGQPGVRLITPEYRTKTQTVPDDLLRELESRYGDRGIRSGRMLLLRPEDALNFLEEASQSGIGVLGPEYWFAPSNEYYPSPDYSRMLDGDDFVGNSVRQAKYDVLEALPDGIAWVSFVLAIPLSDDTDRLK